MPTAIAYRRAPLVDPALVPLSDAAVHADGLQKQLTELALGLVDLNRMSPLDEYALTRFLPEHFMEAVPFDYMEISYIFPEDEKKAARPRDPRWDA